MNDSINKQVYVQQIDNNNIINKPVNVQQIDNNNIINKPINVIMNNMIESIAKGINNEQNLHSLITGVSENIQSQLDNENISINELMKSFDINTIINMSKSNLDKEKSSNICQYDIINIIPDLAQNLTPDLAQNLTPDLAQNITDDNINIISKHKIEDNDGDNKDEDEDEDEEDHPDELTKLLNDDDIIGIEI
jgi:hypothetical protein